MLKTPIDRAMLVALVFFTAILLFGCGSGVYPGQDAVEGGMANPAQCCYPAPCDCPKVPG